MRAGGDGFVDFLCEQLAPLGPVSSRRMFGKTGLFCGGVMFALVSDEAVYLRVDDGNRKLFAEAAAEPLRYRRAGRMIDLAYWRAPDRLLDSKEELLEWASAALAAARRR